MDNSDDKLRMAVLLFLALVIKGKAKENGAIDDFLVRAVDDLSLCKSFPWGRYTYDDCLFNVYKTIEKYKTGGTKTECIPRFILPLEVLAFECIDVLKDRFRENVPPAEDDCPILCRGKFKKSAQKGFSLQELHKTLGDSTVIHSTLVHEGEEDDFIAPSELYVNNVIVDGWNRIITEGGSIFWEDMYRLDIESRGPASKAPEVLAFESPEVPALESQAPETQAPEFQD